MLRKSTNGGIKMNMFTSALEQAFDEYLKKAKGMDYIDHSNPVMEEIYRNELAKFASFLVDEYEQSGKESNYWLNRALAEEQDE